MTTVQQLDNELAKAKSIELPVFIYVYADWSTDTVRMDKILFTIPEIDQRLRKNYVAIKTDISNDYGKNAPTITKHLDILGAPAMLIFDKNGTSIIKKYGYIDKKELIEILDIANLKIHIN